MAVPKGFDVPFRLVRETESPSTVEGDAALDRSIRTIIQTFPGERPYRPSFGSGAASGVFSNMTEESAVRIATEIRRALSAWEQRISVLDITFVVEDSTIDLIITWRPTGRDSDSTTTIQFET